MSGMDKDLCVSLVVATRNQLFHVDRLSADSIVFFRNNHFVAGRHLGNLVCKEDKQINNSVLLSLSLVKFCQFGDSLPFPLTLRLTPLPRFDLVSALRLDGRHSSNTMYVLSYLLVLYIGYPVVHSFQLSVRFSVAKCSPVLNHHR